MENAKARKGTQFGMGGGTSAGPAAQGPQGRRTPSLGGLRRRLDLIVPKLFTQINEQSRQTHDNTSQEFSAEKKGIPMLNQPMHWYQFVMLV